MGDRNTWRHNGLLGAALADIPDWAAALLGGRGRSLSLQPWRKGRALPAGTRIVEAMPELPPVDRTAPQIYGDVSGLSRLPTLEPALPSRRVFVIPGAHVLPQHVVLDAAGRQLLPIALMMGKEFHHHGIWQGRGRAWSRAKVRRALTQTLDEPVFVADAHEIAYGHALLEVIPRLLMLDRAPPGVRILTSFPMVEPYRSMFLAMGVDLARVTTLEGPVYAPQVYIPESPVDLRKFVRPEAWQAFAALGQLSQASRVDPPARIYLSRSRGHRRILRDEDRVEALFARYGFTIVHMQDWPLSDQIRLLSKAEMIAGPSSSAMHNVVFAPASARVLILARSDLILPIDSYLMREEGALAYVLGQRLPGDDRPRYLANWSIALGDVEQAIQTHFGL